MWPLATWSTGNPSSPCLTHILHMSVTVLLGSVNPCWVLSVSLDVSGVTCTLQCASCESLDFRLSVLPLLAIGVQLFNTPSDCTASSPSTLSSRGMRLEINGVVQWVLCCVYGLEELVNIKELFNGTYACFVQVQVSPINLH